MSESALFCISSKKVTKDTGFLLAFPALIRTLNIVRISENSRFMLVYVISSSALPCFFLFGFYLFFRDLIYLRMIISLFLD